MGAPLHEFFLLTPTKYAVLSPNMLMAFEKIEHAVLSLSYGSCRPYELLDMAQDFPS